ncbi:uncharacterized protein V6R79_010369 [Siganus canaliculatus]
MTARQSKGFTFWNSSFVDQFNKDSIPPSTGSLVKNKSKSHQRLVVNAKSMASTKEQGKPAPRKQHGRGSHSRGQTAPRSQVNNKKVSKKPAPKKDTEKAAKPVKQKEIQLAPPPKVNPWGTVKISSTSTRCQELDVAEFPLLNMTEAKHSRPFTKVVKVDDSQGPDPEPLRESPQTPASKRLPRPFDDLPTDVEMVDVSMNDVVKVNMSMVDLYMSDVEMVDVSMNDVVKVNMSMVDLYMSDVEMVDVSMDDVDEEKAVLVTAAPAEPIAQSNTSAKCQEPERAEFPQLKTSEANVSLPNNGVVEVHSNQGPAESKTSAKRSKKTRWNKKENVVHISSGLHCGYGFDRDPRPVSNHVKKSHVVKPEEKSLIKPVEESAVVNPAEESSVVQPEEKSSPVKPAEESSVVLPAEESSVVLPAEESSVVLPAEESSVVLPAEESSVVLPAEESSVVLPAEESSVVLPAEESSVVLPAEESSVVLPAEESSVVQPVEESSVVQPEQEAEPKQLCKSPQISSTEKTNKNKNKNKKKNKRKKHVKKDCSDKVDEEKKETLETQQEENMQQEAESVHPGSHEEEGAQEPSTKKKKRSVWKRFCRLFSCCLRPQTKS